MKGAMPMPVVMAKQAKHDELRASMDAVIRSRLPAFYVDTGGRYGVVYKGYYICAFINYEAETIDVTVDLLDDDGTLRRNQEWEVFQPGDTSEIVASLKKMMRLVNSRA